MYRAGQEVWSPHTLGPSRADMQMEKHIEDPAPLKATVPKSTPLHPRLQQKRSGDSCETQSREEKRLCLAVQLLLHPQTGGGNHNLRSWKGMGPSLMTGVATPTFCQHSLCRSGQAQRGCPAGKTAFLVLIWKMPPGRGGGGGRMWRLSSGAWERV